MSIRKCAKSKVFFASEKDLPRNLAVWAKSFVKHYESEPFGLEARTWLKKHKKKPNTKEACRDWMEARFLSWAELSIRAWRRIKELDATKKCVKSKG